jgi:tRNA threonylcarbamoyladenosine biosynthesis protein TsaE
VTGTFQTASEQETVAIGRRLAADLQEGAVVLLYGDLGAGKTAFVRGLAEGLNIPPEAVSSPTFTIMQEYRGGRLPLFHADLYRLSDQREIADLGVEEIAAEGVLAIEWAEKTDDPPSPAVRVRIAHGSGDERVITVE